MPKLKPIRINIVEEDGWKNWDYAQTDGVSQWSSDNAWDDWENMDENTCKGYLVNLLQASMTKREQKKITEEDLDRICEYMHEDLNNLESTSRAIMDAHTWAWEQAYTPDDLDIEKSVEATLKNWDWDSRLPDFWQLVLQEEPPEGPREWSPRGRWSLQSLFREFVKHVSYERKKGYYDRFLVFDWGNSEPVQLLLEALKRQPNEGSRADVEAWLQEMVDSYMKSFFKTLEDRMQDNDPSHSFDLDPHWKSMLKDKSTMKAVRDELLEFLAQPKKEEVE